MYCCLALGCLVLGAGDIRRGLAAIAPSYSVDQILKSSENPKPYILRCAINRRIALNRSYPRDLNI